MSDMSGELTLGLDIGTSAVKVLVIDEGGWWRLATFPTPPLELLVEEMNNHLRQWMDESDLSRVSTIGVCGQGQSAIVLDDENRVLGEIITWQDRPEPELIEEYDRLFPFSWRIDNMDSHLPEGRAWLPVKLKQWALRHPNLISKANVAIQVKDLVNYSLTGVVCSDRRSFRGMVENTELLEWIGLGDILPDFRTPTEILGQAMGADVIVGTCDMSAGLEGLYLGLGVAGNLANTSEHIAIHPSSLDEVPHGMTYLPACGILPAVMYSSTSSGGEALLHGMSQIKSAPSVADHKGCSDWLLRNHGESGGPVFDAHVRGNRGPGADPRHTGGWQDDLEKYTDGQLATSLIGGLNAALQPIVDKIPKWNRMHVGGGLADVSIITQSRNELWSNVHRRQGKEVSALGIARIAQLAAAPSALIFGAGKVGRGFLADLLYNSGWSVRFVDSDESVVAELNRMGHHVVHRLNEYASEQRIRNCGATLTGSKDMMKWIDEADLLLTSIGAGNLESWCEQVRSSLQARLNKGPLDIILAENHHSPARLVSKALAINNSGLGVIQSQILRSCIEPTEELREQHGALVLRIQDHQELPMDGDASKRPELLALVEGFSLRSNFELELTRKVYTYNSINAVISYLGHLKGYELLADAANDTAILSLAEQAGLEASEGLIAEHGFDRLEQEQWVSRALTKYRNHDIVDPIERQCRDPMRKLAANDRLLGPIMLCLKHELPCKALATGLLAAIRYDPDAEASARDPSIGELRKKRKEILAQYELRELEVEACELLNGLLNESFQS